MAGPLDAPDSLSTSVRKLMERSYDTYKARIAARDRLHARFHAWNVSMIALSGSVVVAGLGLLKDSNMYGSQGDLLLAAVGVMSLVASLVVANANYGARSENMERSYKQIQALSVLVESFYADPQSATVGRYELMRGDYAQLLETSENQSSGDYARAKASSRTPPSRTPASLQRACLKETAITAAPYLSLILPLALLAPFTDAIFSG